MEIVIGGGAERKIEGQIERNNWMMAEIALSKAIEHQVQNILYIPDARRSDEEMYEYIYKFTQLFEGSGLNIVTSFSSEEEFVNLQAVGTITLISGGSQIKLMDAINSNGALKAAILNSKCIIGESAGGMALGEYFYDDNPEDKQVYEGLGLLPILPIPHLQHRYLHTQLMDNAVEFAKENGVQVIGVDCETYVQLHETNKGEIVPELFDEENSQAYSDNGTVVVFNNNFRSVLEFAD